MNCGPLRVRYTLLSQNFNKPYCPVLMISRLLLWNVSSDCLHSVAVCTAVVCYLVHAAACFWCLVGPVVDDRLDCGIAGEHVAFVLSACTYLEASPVFQPLLHARSCCLVFSHIREDSMALVEGCVLCCAPWLRLWSCAVFCAASVRMSMGWLFGMVPSAFTRLRSASMNSHTLLCSFLGVAKYRARGDHYNINSVRRPIMYFNLVLIAISCFHSSLGTRNLTTRNK